MNNDLALTGVKGSFPFREVMNDQGSQGKICKDIDYCIWWFV